MSDRNKIDEFTITNVCEIIKKHYVREGKTMTRIKLFSFLLQKRSVFRSWIILFFMMTLIAFLLMCLYYYSLNKALEQNIKDYNQVKVDQLKTEIDSAVLRLSMIATSVANREEIKNRTIMSFDARKKLLSDFALMLETNRNIFDIVIYLKPTEEIIASNCIVKEPYFYMSSFNTEILARSEWLNLLKSEQSNYFYFFPFQNQKEKNDYKLTYILNLGDDFGKIMVALNIESVLNGDPYFSKVFVCNELGIPYLLYGKDNKNDYFFEGNLPEKTEIYKITRENYISVAKSSMSEMKYLIYTEKGVFNKNLHQLQYFSFIYLFIFVIVGLILACYFAIRQYKPLNGIVDVLNKAIENKSIERKNEYTEIKDRISAILQKSARLSREVNKQMKYIQERAVVNLLKGKVLSTEMRNLFPMPQKDMVVVRLICDEKNALSFGNDLDLLQFAVKNVSEEIFSQIADVYPAELDGAICLLMYLKQGVGRNEIYEIAKKLGITMQEQVQVDVEIIIGSITMNVKQLPVIYNEILETSQFSTGFGEILETDILKERKPEAYTYTVYAEMNIITCVKNGDFDAANEIISSELDEIIYHKKYPIYLIRCFMIDLTSTILKALGEVKRSRDDLVDVQTGNISKLFSSSSIAEMEEIVRAYLKEVCDFVVKTNSRCSSTICEEIKQYVKENFADSEMNVNALAEHFHLNAAYLSNMFKKNTDIKLLEYLNKVRIEEAKKIMIKNPKLSVEEVAEMTGFANSRSFRRIFLKYEAIPPSKFLK